MDDHPLILLTKVRAASDPATDPRQDHRMTRTAALLLLLALTGCGGSSIPGPAPSAPVVEPSFPTPQETA